MAATGLHIKLDTGSSFCLSWQFKNEGMNCMASMDEQILRAAKEIVVKFIEGGRLSPTAFHDTFRKIYKTIEETVRASAEHRKPE